MISTAQVNKSIREMLVELASVKQSAQYLINKLSNEEPQDFMNAGTGDLSNEDKSGLGGEEMLGSEDTAKLPMDEKEEKDKEKIPEIKTPEEAKKTVNEAINDLKGVVEGIDAITGQGEDMAEKTSSKTFRLSSRVQTEIGLLTQQAIAAIDDAKGAIRHWSFLLKRKASSALPKKSPLREVVENVKEAKQAWHELGTVFATAVPPTGAEFSGDKGINGDINYSAKKEIKHYQAGNEEFHKDKAKEDALPNAAAEPRLVDEGNPHELGAYVNAKVVNKNNVFSSALVVRALNPEKKGKYAVVTWDKLSPAVGEKTAENYAIFTSPAFAKNVEYHVRKNGLENVAAYLNAEVDTIGLATTSEREPKVKDKAKLRAYYKDAFGDAEFAKELTSSRKSATNLGAGINESAANAGTKSGDDMNVNYTPEMESANDTEGGLNGGNDSDSVGSGKPKTEASIEVRRAKARAAVDFSRLAASRGVVPFTKTAVAEYARKVVEYDDVKFAAQKELLMSMPIVNEAALKEARIPDDQETESGILANTHEAVSKPMNKNVSTEGVDSEVKANGKISQASFVPQMQVTSALNKTSFINALDTYANRLRKQGLDPESESYRKVRPHYRKK
jgi:hypothetical protein